MTVPPNIAPESLQYYATAAYPCSYIEGQLARSQVATPITAVGEDHYDTLIRHGFRRSGAFVYRPQCDHCQACTSIRLPVAAFTPNRSQRRAWTRHANLQSRVTRPHFSEEHYALYSRYQNARHTGGGMDQDDVVQYMDFLVRTHVTTIMVEFREPGQNGAAGELKMVSIVDQLNDGLSAVYTFYSPEPGQSLGTFNVLWQIAYAKSLNLTHLYLGYWIEACAKMSYKSRFRPSEMLIRGAWTSTP